VQDIRFIARRKFTGNVFHNGVTPVLMRLVAAARIEAIFLDEQLPLTKYRPMPRCPDDHHPVTRSPDHQIRDPF
jgi:hypothetical protein